MKKIASEVRLIYYMMLNKGEWANDPEALDIRVAVLPITINDAQDTIESLCLRVSAAADVPKDAITVNEITTKNFCHFWFDPISKHQKIIEHKQPRYKHNRMNGCFRRVK